MQPASIRRLRDPRTWTFDLLLPAIALLLVAALAACMNAQSDTWWLLRAGRDTLIQRQVPLIDTYATANTGRPWFYHEWMTGALYYAAFSLGGMPLLLAVCTSIVTGTWLLIYRLSEGPGRFRAGAILLSIVVCAPIWSMRPQLVTQLFTVAALYLLNHPRRHLLYPLLLLAWANFHAGVLTGVLILGIAWFVALVRQRDQLRSWTVIGLVSSGLTLLNPLGVGLWEFALGTVFRSHPAYTSISEWQPISFSSGESLLWLVLVGLVALAAWTSRRTWTSHRDWTVLLCAAAFIAMSVQSARHSSFVALVAPLVLTRPFAQAPAASAIPGAGRANQALALLTAAGALALVGTVWSRRPAPLSAPIIAAVRDCEGALYNTYAVGGELLWFVPERPPFIDNRLDMYTPEVFAATSEADAGKYQDLFAAHSIRCALVTTQEPLYPALRRDGWSELAADSGLAVLKR